MKKIIIVLMFVLFSCHGEKIIYINNGNETVIVKSPDEKLHSYYIHTSRMASKHGVSFEVLINIIKVESGFNPVAVNKNTNGTTDLGIAQINNKYIRYFEWKYNIDINPLDPYQSIEFMAKHMAYLMKRFDSTYLAVCAYNCGETSVSRGKIPNSTKAYAKKVLSF